MSSEHWSKVLQGEVDKTVKIHFLTRVKQTVTIKFVTPDGEIWSKVVEHYDPENTVCTYCKHYRCIESCLCDICKQ